MVTWNVPQMTFHQANLFAQYVRALPKVAGASVTMNMRMLESGLMKTPTLRIIALEGAGTPEEFQNLVLMYAQLWWETQKQQGKAGDDPL